MKRLALLVPNLRVGGAERAFVFLANALAGIGVDVDLVVVDAAGPLRGQIDAGVRLVDLGSGSMLAGLPGLRRYLRAERPSALISTLTYANVVAVWARRLAGTGTPVLVREATTLSRNRGSGLKARLVLRLVRRAYSAADRVIAVSRGVADDLADNFGVPRERIRVIANPALPGGLEQLVGESVDHPWVGDASVPWILAVGRMTDAKDYPTLVRALAWVRERREARLVILGDGELRDPLTALVRELGLEGAISMPGFVDNPFAWMARASLFVLSSRFEGMPNVLIQAMACGCPVVSTDCENGPREILEDGAHGPLVPVGDPVALGRAILSSLDGPRASRAAVARALDFSAERVARAYLDVARESGATPA